jgi:hypothetical protein
MNQESSLNLYNNENVSKNNNSVSEMINVYMKSIYDLHV